LDVGQKRKRHSSDFKARVALEADKGDRSLSELASRYEVHPTQIGQWRKAWLSRVPEIFSAKRQRQEADDEAEKARLYEEIGRLKVEVDWLKNEVDGLAG
jgi:transposase-like protein